MIKSFCGKQTERVFLRVAVSKFFQDVYRKALRKLLLLDAAETLEDLRILPGTQLEKLVGDRKGQCNLRVNDRWRLCFRWEEGDTYEVEIVDYH
jgi:toxin HigB-1